MSEAFYISDLIHENHDPFAMIGVSNITDLQGWNSESKVFERLIFETQASRICEIGTWKGASAIHMARLLKAISHEHTDEIVCVDTFLGSLEMWTDKEKRDLMQFKSGRAGIYETFLQNIMNTGFDNIITPFPTTSSIAAKFFRHHHVRFDLIYIDASHETKDVFADICDYENLAPVIFGDDYDWPSVRAAVDSFHNQRLREFDLEISNEKWILRRKPS